MTHLAAVGILGLILAALWFDWFFPQVRRQRQHCPHSNLRGIYGDEINICGGYRLNCRDCGCYLNGSVGLARSRKAETRVES